MSNDEFLKNREASLKWWRNLFHLEKEEYAKKHFPNLPFAMVYTSSSKIQKIWESEIDKKN